MVGTKEEIQTKKKKEEEKEIQFKRKPVILKATIFQLIEKKPTEQIKVV